MFKKLFKFDKTDIELKRELYEKSLLTVTEHYNGIRINETLIGRIKGSRMTEMDCDISEEKEPKIKVLRSVPRPEDFGSDLSTWMAEVRNQAKEITKLNKKYEKQEQEYQDKLKEEKNAKLLEERRKFYVNYGLLPKIA